MAHVSDHAVIHHFICQFKNGFEIEWKHFHGLATHIKEVFSEKSCFKNFAHPLSEKENIKK